MSTAAPPTDLVVRDAETGRVATVRGAGALKGRLKLDESIDLTKPIASQAARHRRRRKAVTADQ